MKIKFSVFGSILILGLVLTACAQSSSFGDTIVYPDRANSEIDQQIVNIWPDGLTQQDKQGAIVVTISPLNLNDPQNTLDFSVSLDTHSVDLNMDLADMATLSTNTGVMVDALTWDGPRGGHHVNGILSFPSILEDAELLVDVSALELTIQNLDVSERVFTWERLEQ